MQMHSHHKTKGIKSHDHKKLMNLKQVDSLQNIQQQTNIVQSPMNNHLMPVTTAITIDQKIIQLEQQLKDEQLQHREDLIEMDTKEKQLQQKVAVLLGEIEKLNRFCVQKSEELEKWRYKCLNMESNKVHHLNQEEVNRYNIQTKEIESQLQFYQNKFKETQLSLENVQDQNAQLQSLVDTKSEENDILRAKILRLEGQIFDSFHQQKEVLKLREQLDIKTLELQEVIGNNQQYNSLEARNYELSSEVTKLKASLRAHADEKESLKEMIINERNNLETEIQKLEKLLQEKNQELESKQVRFEQSFKDLRLAQDEKLQTQRLLQLKQEECDEWKNKFIRIEKTIAELRGQDNQNVQAFAEIDRYRHQIQVKSDEIQQWIFRYNQVEQEYEDLKLKLNNQSEILLYQQENTNMKNQIERLNSIIRDMQGQGDLKNDIISLKSQLTTLQSKNNQLTQDRDNLQQQLYTQDLKIKSMQREFMQDKEDLMQKVIDLESQQRRVSSRDQTQERILEERITRLTSDLEIQKKMYQQVSNEFDSWKSKYYVNQSNDSEMWRQKYQQAQVEIEFCNTQIQNQEAKYRQLLDDFSRTKNQILPVTSQQDNSRIQLAISEIEKLQGINRSRLKEIEELRNKYNALERNQGEIQGYKEKIKLLEAEVLSWKQRANSQVVSSSQQDEIQNLNALVYRLQKENLMGTTNTQNNNQFNQTSNLYGLSTAVQNNYRFNNSYMDDSSYKY